MAREIKEIYNGMLATKNADVRLASLNNSSETAIWKLIFMVCATAIWSLEKLFDIHLQSVEDKLALLKPHSLNWYRNKVLSYQHGGSFDETTGLYDNTGLTASQIATQQIITNCAVVERGDSSLMIKVAKTVSNALAPLSTPEVLALQSYIFQIKDAGVQIIVSSIPADNLKLEVEVYIDPLEIQNNGLQVGGSVKPVEESVKLYLKSLPFNAEFTKMDLVDAIQKVKGVKVVEVLSAQAKENAATTFNNVISRYQTASGYMVVQNEDLVINYKVYANQL